MVRDKSESEILLKSLQEIQCSLQEELILLQEKYNKSTAHHKAQNLDTFAKKVRELRKKLNQCHKAIIGLRIGLRYDNSESESAEQILRILEAGSSRV